MEQKELFDNLYSLDVNGKTEKKNGLTYLSWAYAWAEFKKICPDATYEIVKQQNGLPYAYDPNTGYMVYTRVTAAGITHEMWLPVMDSSNHALKSEPYTIRVKNSNFEVKPATMFDVNKAIMRCLTKNLAMFGLGLYIYAGEDLPEGAERPQLTCSRCGSVINPAKKDGVLYSAEDVAANTGGLCFNCYRKKYHGND